MCRRYMNKEILFFEGERERERMNFLLIEWNTFQRKIMIWEGSMDIHAYIITLVSWERETETETETERKRGREREGELSYFGDTMNITSCIICNQWNLFIHTLGAYLDF